MDGARDPDDTAEAKIWGKAIDFDTHYYEADDCFSRHIDPKYRDDALTPRATDGRGTVWTMGQEPMTFLPPGIPQDFVPGPGLVAGLFNGNDDVGSAANLLEGVLVTKEHPELFDRQTRLRFMDDQGVQAALAVPTVGVVVEQDCLARPDALCANFEAFNRWVEDDWGFGADGRIFGVPMLTLVDVDWAVQELQRVAEQGSRFVCFGAGPVGGRSPADPYFDRFWSVVQETGVKPIFHIGFEGFTRLYGVHWGEDGYAGLHEYTAMQHYLCFGERPISDHFAALVLHNLFGRFPGIEVITIENGSAWVRPLLRQLDKAARMGRSGRWLGGPLNDLPSEIFANHVHVNPFWEEDIVDLAEIIGVDHILFGSDWPHPEGLARPLDYVHNLARQFDDASITKIMRGNGAALLGLAG